MWSFGVILYILLGGYPPFHHDNQRELFKLIVKGVYVCYVWCVVCDIFGAVKCEVPSGGYVKQSKASHINCAFCHL